ncbi:MAG: type II secretion system F family protein [Negativicutes bacterium]|nr:type II secretion system F family protein [Negativicutes bacterium]
MLLLISCLTFIVFSLLLYLVLTTYASSHGSIAMRLKALDSLGSGRTDIDAELAKPFTQRVVSPLTGELARVVMRVTPQALRKLAEEKMATAGGFGNLSPGEFLLLTGFLAVALPAVTAFLAFLGKLPLHKIVGVSMVAFAVGCMLPFFLLRQKIAIRKKNIQKDLPDVLDILTVSVEAGLGFDGALAKLSEKMKGALVDEFNRVLQEIRVGVPRREALHAMGLRCGVPDLAIFTTSLVQADQLGVSIGNVLRVQSAAMREKRRQRAREMAMKAPIKMLLPMVLFIFPTIFVVLLGPAAIQIFETFKK